VPVTRLDTAALLDRICERIRERIDPAAIAAAKRRQGDMFAGRESDYIPLIFSRPADEADELPCFDWAEQFHDPAKSLYMQLKRVLGLVATHCDTIASVRADTGVINCMSLFGVKYVVPAHTKPVVREYASKERLKAFQVPADISRVGVIPRMLEHMRHHKSALAERDLGELVSLSHCDTQGPFDIAAQTRGHDVFIDLYDDGDFAHDLMAKCTQVYIGVTRLCKAVSGDPPDGGNASGYWSRTGGVRICGDSDVLISAALHQEFVRPCLLRAFDAFGGGWLHY